MDLFKKVEKGKVISSDGTTVILTFKSNGKFEIEVTQDTIKVTPKGMMNALNKGLVGSKTYAISNLTGVQYKPPGFSTGYMQFIALGTAESKHGVTGAVRDENTITFSKKEVHLVLELKEFIEHKLASKVSGDSAFSKADELLKFKKLLDDGVLTQEEFEKEKARILG